MAKLTKKVQQLLGEGCIKFDTLLLLSLVAQELVEAKPEDKEIIITILQWMCDENKK